MEKNEFGKVLTAAHVRKTLAFPKGKQKSSFGNKS